MALNSSLLQWLSTFKLDGQTSIELKEDDAYYNLADGYVCARILNQISPKNFPNEWLDGIKPVQPNGSWRFRVSNLKRILQKIHDYASDLQSPQFKNITEIAPDVLVIAQNFDSDQISKLIQLILFCAINCPNKQDYIEKIQSLPKQVKQDIKEAIEELLVKNNDNQYQRLNASHNDSVDIESDTEATTTTNQHHLRSTQSNSAILFPAKSSIPHSSSSSTIYKGPWRRDSDHSTSNIDSPRRGESNNNQLDSSSNNYDSPLLTPKELRQKLNDALTIKDAKAQACHELEIKLNQLQLEKEQLALENDRLLSERSATNTASPRRLSGATAGNVMNNSGFRRLSHQLYHNQQQQGDDRSSTVSNSNLNNTSAREFENRLKMMDIEDEQAQNVILQRNRKLQIELNKLKEEMIKIETEKEDYRLKSELLKEDLLKVTSKHDELRDKAEQAKRLQDELDEQKEISEKVINYETIMENLVKKNNDIKKDFKSLEEKNLKIKNKLVMLEEENDRLTNSSREIEIYKKQLHEIQVKLSQETYRADKAEVELNRLMERYSSVKKENEKLFEATNQLRKIGGSGGGANTVMRNNPDQMSTALAGAPAGNSADTTLVNNCNNQLVGPQAPTNLTTDQDNIALINRIEELQRLLFQKEQELIDSEAKYKRNLQKAKEVMKNLNQSNLTIMSGGVSLHPSQISSTSSFNCNSIDEANLLLRQQLKEREDRLIELEREFYEYKKCKEIHERLMISAFYGLSLALDSPLNLLQNYKTTNLRSSTHLPQPPLSSSSSSKHLTKTTEKQWKNVDKRLERTTLTSPPNTASSSMNHSKHSH